MKNPLQVVTIASLLHDIGKVCFRASGERKTHSVLGSDFLFSFCQDTEEGKQVLQCVKYHHGKELRKADLHSDALAYVVYEADNIAAGMDRRENDSQRPWEGFDATLSLANVCNVLEGEGKDSYFPVKKLDAMIEPSYPLPDASHRGTPGAYGAIEDSLKANFQRKAPQDMMPNELLRILEDILSYVPSSTAKGEVCDISLYDHVKMTAAIASSMWRYLQAHHISDYKDFCMTHNEMHRQEETMLFISADFSGIQKFIYRVPTKGAMRMLRGRSFYLQMVMENIIDEILEKLGLSRANLIYSGGGHFYMLADNTEETQTILEDAFHHINEELMHSYGTSLYVAAGWVPVSANDLREEGMGKKNMFRRVNEVIAQKKQSRYDASMVAMLTDETSELNHIEGGMRECALCHRSVKESELSPYQAPSENGDEVMQVCSQCNGMYILGRDIIDHKPVFAALNQPVEGSLSLPSPFDSCYLKTASMDMGHTWLDTGILKRVYAKNMSVTSEEIGTRLWIGDYACQNEKGKALDFEEMATYSGGSTEEKGIKRLGVLRADVDWLGAVFMAGLKLKYRTFSRYAALSRNLSMFFSHLITAICEKNLPQGQKPFYLFQAKEKNRYIHVVYAGGDDLFLVGAWDDLLETAVDLRETFRHYTNGKLSFSAGLGLFSPSYPVIRMAQETGALEDLAKKAPGKDSMALFGIGEGETPVFTWDEFEKKVCGEKLDFLLHHMILTGINDTEEPQGRIVAGKSLLYRILGLLEKKPFNLARFAYTLARLEPVGKEITVEEKSNYEDIRNKMYQWGRALGKERLELETALRLVIYRMRDTEK